MDTLRWILLVIGILVLVGIYLVGKRGEWLKRGRGGRGQYDPRFDDEGPDVLGLSDSEEEWVDDVRPVRSKPASNEEAPAFIASRDDLPPASHAPSLAIDDAHDDAPQVHEHIELSAQLREEPSEDDWVDDVRPVHGGHSDAAGGFEAERTLSAPPASSSDESEADDEGWVDDVRPIERDIPPPTAQGAGGEAGRGIPASVALEVGEQPTHEEDNCPEDVLVIHVAAAPSVGRFKGEDLVAAFADLDLSYGPQGIYHREAGIGAPMFSIVNRIKPGTFEPERIGELRTPGVTLFMQLPGPDQPMVAFRVMSDCARKLAERLGGQLEDEQHAAMTPQMFSRYEKRVRFHVSGLYRRMSEAADEQSAQAQTGDYVECETTEETSPEAPMDVYQEPRSAEGPSAPHDTRPEPESPQEADRDDSTLADRAGNTARKLFGRYEARMRSFVSGLSQRLQEPVDDDVSDPLMRKSGERPGTAHTDASEGRGRDGATAEVRTDESHSTLERAASRHKPARRDKTHVEPEPGMPEELLIIHIVADPAIGSFGGEHIAEAFQGCDLSYGEMQIYHRESKSGPPMFSVVNMINPGTFDPSSFSELETPGISLFMQLPGPEQPMVAFRNMSDCARRLAEQLGGRLQDETRSTMTMQTLSHYEERVRSFIQHQARLAGGRRG
ncbi:MAG: cell division protein ZipA [Acidihalobacter sp.]|uniref:cell division protein ZipA n=1 Tax=Acidihalobacter sp. TaxID=1872108 RepID=UPI00307FA61D